jgi:hypothetical protein
VTAFALGVVAAAILDILQGSSAVTALVPLARVTDDIGSKPTYPYVQVEGYGEQPFNTMGAATSLKYGSSTRVSVRIVSQYRGEHEVGAIADAVRAALDGQSIIAGTYPAAIATFEQAVMLRDTVQGIVTRELVLDFNVTVHQTS